MNKIYNFENLSEYIFDTNKIELSGGLVKLKEDLTNVYAIWHLNEATGATVLDSSGNGRNGTPINSPVSVAGKLNNCLSFNGTNQYVECGQTGNFERTQPFSFECWFKTSNIGQQIFASKMMNSGNYTGWDIWYEGTGTNRIYFDLCSIATSSMIRVYFTDNSIANNTLHHLIITYDGSSTSGGVKFYYDNYLKSTSAVYNSLSSSILTTTSFQISGRGYGAIGIVGLLDEIIIYNKELSASEVSYRYNSGVGRENWYYPIDNPTINPLLSWNVSGLSQWFAFAETLGTGNQGNFGYQLSNDDGVTYYYWNGSAWAVATTQYNSATVIGAHIATFSITNSKIMFKVFLISNGVQQCNLDAIEITATVGYPPNVYAGADKNCRSHEIKKPFSDAVINDPDGNIENATAYRKIESGIWTQILKGGYGTLQDAIRNFEYTFDNLGAITCELKIVDEQAFENTDSMVETVSKYQVTFNIRDSDANHLGNVLCNFDDGLGWLMKNSPFTYEFEWKSGNYLCTFDKTGFISQTINVPVSDHTENITLQRLTVDPSAIADAVWDELKTSHQLTNSFGKETQDIKVDTTSIISTLSTLIVGIWAYGTRTLTSFGTLIADIWANTIRTITACVKGTQIDAIKAKTDNLPSNPASETGLLAKEATLINKSSQTSIDLVKTETDKIQSIKAKTDNIPPDPASETLVKRILGLSQENYRLFNIVYDNGLVISATIKIYPTSNNCESDSDPLAIYNVNASYSEEGKLVSYKVKKI